MKASKWHPYYLVVNNNSKRVAPAEVDSVEAEVEEVEAEVETEAAEVEEEVDSAAAEEEEETVVDSKEQETMTLVVCNDGWLHDFCWHAVCI